MTPGANVARGGSEPSVLEVRLEQHLTEASLRSALGAVEPSLHTLSEALLLVDCQHMTGYDAEARSLFVEWNRKHRKYFKGVAIVTDKLLWQMVVSTMRLASGQEMRAFGERYSAMDWLQSL